MDNTQSRRLTVLDAARGTAMLLVCTSHFLDAYGENLRHDDLIIMFLLALTKVATPSFVLISGILLGYLHARNGDFSRLRIHLLDRALFLVTVGHILMAATFATRWGWVRAVSQSYITDTLGLCLCGGVLLLKYIQSPSQRLGLGILFYLMGWAGWNNWHSDHQLLLLLKGLFLGPDGNGGIFLLFPLVPWFGVYLIGTSVGAWLSTFRQRDLPLAGKLLVKPSLVAFGAGLFIKALLAWLQIPRSLYLPFLSLSKSPPGPLYLLTFGSAALILIGSLLVLVTSSRSNGYCVSILQRLGRNSFSVFLGQSFLYYTVIHLLAVHTSTATPLFTGFLLAASLLCIIGLSGLFERIGLTRAWTVGLPVLVEKWQTLDRRSSAASVAKG